MKRSKFTEEQITFALRQHEAGAAKDPPLFRAERIVVIQHIRNERRYSWRTSSEATRQSHAEDAVSRFKGLAGVKFAAREFGNQQVEAQVKCRVWNCNASLGLPISERILQGWPVPSEGTAAPAAT